MLKRFWNTTGMQYVREIGSIYFEKGVSRAAAALAFSLVFSFFPILLFLNAFIGFMDINVEAILSTLQPVFPPSLLNIISDYLRYISVNESPAMMAAGIIMIVLAASSAMRSLMNFMGDIFGERNFKGWRLLLASIIFPFFLLITIYVSLAVVLTGNWFAHLFQRYMPFLFPNGEVQMWQWMRFLLLFGMVFLLIIMVYRMSAPRGTRVFLGSIGAAVALVLASMIFSGFIGASTKYSLVYGSLASVVIMLLWLYLVGHILILGNVFNYVRERRKKAKMEGLEPWPPREKSGKKKKNKK